MRKDTIDQYNSQLYCWNHLINPDDNHSDWSFSDDYSKLRGICYLEMGQKYCVTSDSPAMTGSSDMKGKNPEAKNVLSI
jgi:hypothetical protein